MAQKTITGNYTITPSDNNDVIFINSIKPLTITVQSTGFTSGAEIAFINIGIGRVDFISGNTAKLIAFNGELVMAGQGAVATLIRYDSSPTWSLSGNMIK